VTSHRILERVENHVALAVDGRQRLTVLGDMLRNIHAQGRPLSDYNLHIATEDINATIAALWQLQDELCRFKGNST
jgi:hypothetical protein